MLNFVTHTSRRQCAARRAVPCSPECMFTTTKCSLTTTTAPAPTGRQPTRHVRLPLIYPMLATGRVSTSRAQCLIYRLNLLLKEEIQWEVKLQINSNIIEEINTFSYRCCSISYQNERDVTVKISTFLQISGITDRTLKSSQVQKHIRQKIYHSLPFLTL